MRMLASNAKGDFVRILAIWFGVAVVVGLLLGYAARRLKGAPKGQQHIRSVSNADVENSGDRDTLASSAQCSAKTGKRYRRRWRN
jgi:hypothetical protein